MDDIGDDHVDSMDMANCVQQPRLSTEQEGSSQRCPLGADEQALKNGDSQVDSGTLSEAPETAETVSMASDHLVEQENAIPSPNQTGSDVDSRPHTNTSEEVDNGQVLSTEQASSGDIDHADARNENSDGTEPSAIIIDAVDQSINSEDVPNLQVESITSGGADQTTSADARQENPDGMELEMAVFRFSDVADQNDIVDHESVINGSLMPGLTRRDSPPSYESVLRERSTFITIQPPDCEEVSTTTDNNTIVDVNVITTQPQSNIANSPSMASDRDSAANYNQDDIISDSDSELAARIDYLRRHRRERGGIDETECCDNLGLFCTDCCMCAPSGHTSQEIQMRGNYDDVVTTQPLSSSTVSQPAVDANLPVQSVPEVDSTTEQLTRDSQSESTECACCDPCCDYFSGCCDWLTDCCDACGRCCTSDEMECFCEVSWKIGSDILNYNSFSPLPPSRVSRSVLDAQLLFVQCV